MLPQTFTAKYLSRLELLKVRARRAFVGHRQGGHISQKRGHGIEFSDYRRYELGDNPRHIDWGLYARSDRLYVKRFQEEENLSVLVIVDGSESMHTPESDGKWEKARDVALSIAYVALMEQDTVALSIPGSWHSPSYYGARAFHQLGDAVMQLNRKKTFDFEREMHAAVARVRFPGVAVFISDFMMTLEQIEQIVNIMRARGLDVTAIQVLGESDIHPLANYNEAIAVDSESGAEVQLSLTDEARRDYEEFLKEHSSAVREFFRQARIPFAFTAAKDNLADFIAGVLPRTGLLQ